MKFRRTAHRSFLILPAGILLALLCSPACLPGQPTPSITGDYVGSLGPLSLRLHVKTSEDASLTCTLDSPNQGANALPCADVHRDGSALTFTIPGVHGSWKGGVSPDGHTLSGTWDQGSPTPLNFSRDTFVPAAAPSAVDGLWLGTLHAGTASLRIQITVRTDVSRHTECILDSLDQRAYGLPCAKVTFAAPHFSFEVPAVKGNWNGDLSADGKQLTGTWTQGAGLPLDFDRQPSLQTGAATP